MTSYEITIQVEAENEKDVIDSMLELAKHLAQTNVTYQRSTFRPLSALDPNSPDGPDAQPA